MNTTLNTPQSEEPDGRLDIAGALASGIQVALSQATEAAGLPEATWTLTLDGPGSRPRLTGLLDIRLTADEVQAAVQAYANLLGAETTSRARPRDHARRSPGRPCRPDPHGHRPGRRAGIRTDPTTAVGHGEVADRSGHDVGPGQNRGATHD